MRIPTTAAVTRHVIMYGSNQRVRRRYEEIRRKINRWVGDRQGIEHSSSELGMRKMDRK
jgi:hypothetical protein